MVRTGLTMECCGATLSVVKVSEGVATIEQRGGGEHPTSREAIKVARRLLAERAQRFLGVFGWTIHDGDHVLEAARPPEGG